MLEVKLKELLAKNNTNIAELSDHIATNRASLTQLANGNSKMIKFETLDKIISAFNITDLSELFRIVSPGKIIATLKSRENATEFTVNFQIHFEPIRGKKTNYTLPVSFSFSRLKGNSYILQGTSLNNIPEKIKNIFHQLEDDEISKFVSIFWDDLIHGDKDNSPVLNISNMEEFKGSNNAKGMHIFFVVDAIPQISKIINIDIYHNFLMPDVYPSTPTKSILGLADNSLTNRPVENKIILISDLYSSRKKP